MTSYIPLDMNHKGNGSYTLYAELTFGVAGSPDNFESKLANLMIIAHSQKRNLHSVEVSKFTTLMVSLS